MLCQTAHPDGDFGTVREWRLDPALLAIPVAGSRLAEGRQALAPDIVFGVSVFMGRIRHNLGADEVSVRLHRSARKLIGKPERQQRICRESVSLPGTLSAGWPEFSPQNVSISEGLKMTPCTRRIL